MSPVVSQAETDPADRVDQLGVALIELAAEIADVGVDHRRIAAEVVLPTHGRATACV